MEPTMKCKWYREQIKQISTEIDDLKEIQSSLIKKYFDFLYSEIEKFGPTVFYINAKNDSASISMLNVHHILDKVELTTVVSKHLVKEMAVQDFYDQIGVTFFNTKKEALECLSKQVELWNY